MDDEFATLIRQHKGMTLAPNLPARGVATDLTWLSASIPAAELEKIQAGNRDNAEQQKAFGIQARNLVRMSKEGVSVVMGTDGNTPWAPHAEMADMVAAGMTPAQVIVSATRNSAEFLRLADLGTLAAGNAAQTLTLTPSVAAAGSLAGNLTLGLTSTAKAGTNLDNLAFADSIVAITGAAYDYAKPGYSTATLDFGNVRVGASPAAQTVAFTNAAVTDANYQEGLKVVATGAAGKFTASGFDTRGSDGAFGPRSREMVAAWQKARNLPVTGFVNAGTSLTDNLKLYAFGGYQDRDTRGAALPALCTRAASGRTGSAKARKPLNVSASSSAGSALRCTRPATAACSSARALNHCRTLLRARPLRM